MQVLSIYLIGNNGSKAHFGSTNLIQNAEWAKVNLETLKEKGFF